MRVPGKIVFRRDVQVREIAASAAGDTYLGPCSLSMVDHQDGPAALAAFDGAQKARCTGTNDDNVFFYFHRIIEFHRLLHGASTIQSFLKSSMVTAPRISPIIPVDKKLRAESECIICSSTILFLL
jgi:hypothetical protein